MLVEILPHVKWGEEGELGGWGVGGELNYFKFGTVTGCFPSDGGATMAGKKGVLCPVNPRKG